MQRSFMYYVNGPLQLVQSGLSILNSAGYRVKIVVEPFSVPNNAVFCNHKNSPLNVLEVIRQIRSDVSSPSSGDLYLIVID
ncbi:MAG: hypothetical protein K1X92_15380 [Bacteroidia bacterium]|nr:hypothetical protein [Bacteroidia bacterium]